MTPLILHHYPLSPFSEKLRAMLGYAQVPWQSANTREMPPRPVLLALAGGYRRVPIAQIGADVFCDSKTVATEIAALSGKPLLALENCSAEIQEFVVDVERNCFMACIVCGGTKSMGRRIWRSMSLIEIIKFFWDRIQIGRKATVKARGMRDPKASVLKYLAQFEQMLQSQDFLFGAEPTHADFAVYHCLWFVRDVGESPMINDFSRTMAWMDRIKAFGHGMSSEISGEQALETARKSTPRPIAAEHRSGDPLIGSPVQVAPSDYAQVPTAGVLVGTMQNRWILAREEKSVGTVHVHFPRAGFSLNPN